MILWHDLRHAVRSLRASPRFSAAAVLSLALGVGANTSLFATLYAVALRPLPVREASRVVSIHQEVQGEQSRLIRGSPLLLSHSDYRAYRDRAPSLVGLAAFADARFTLGGTTNPESVDGVFATCNYFALLGAASGGDAIAIGRGFTADDCRAPGASPVAVLSDAAWRTRFGADRAVLGRTVTVNGRPLIVVGVAAPDFVGTETTVPGLWIPLEMQPVLEPEQSQLLAAHAASWLNAIGRLRPGASIGAARAELALIARRVDLDEPGRQTRVSVSRGALLSGPEVWRRGLPIAAGVLALGGLVLLMACANVTNLQLARATARQREIGLRVALGASRRRLMRQLLTESLVLCAVSALAGLLIASWLPSLLLSALPSEGLRIALAPDLAVAGYVAALAAASTLLVGLLPALQASRPDVRAALSGSRRRIGQRGSGVRLRGALVVAQVAGSILLLVTAALLVRGVRRGQELDPGFATTNVLAMRLDLRERGYTAARAATLHTQLLERARAIPGVTTAALAARLPLAGRSETQVTADDTPNDGAARGIPAQWTAVSASYFATLGMAVARGRAFGDADRASDGTIPAVITPPMARLWRGRDPLGRHFVAGAERYVVVGVSAPTSDRHLGEPGGMAFFAPPRLDDRVDLRLVVRLAAANADVGRSLRAAVRELDPAAAVHVERIEDVLGRELRTARGGALFASALGALALLLAIVGVHSVVAYAAAQRTHEFGLRLALGARPRDVLTLVLRQGAALTITGLTLGALAAAGVARLLAGLLFGLRTLDPIAFVGVALGVAAIALAAMAMPAWRATRIAPSAAMRGE